MPDTAMLTGLPQWAARRARPDTEFAAAYDAVGARGRALIKRAVAAGYALNPPAPALARRETGALAAGFEVASREGPRPWGAFLLGPDVLSPALYLSALLPLLTARVPLGMVIRICPENMEQGGRVWPDALLTASELAGQEMLLSLTAGEATRLLATLSGSAPGGCVLLLGDTGLDLELPGDVAVRLLDADPAVCVFHDPSMARELAADLEFLYPGLELEVWNGRGWPRGITRRTGDAVTLMKRSPGVVVAVLPEAEALSAALPLVLAPEMAGVHVYPDLGPDFFRMRRLRLAAPAKEGAS